MNGEHRQDAHTLGVLEAIGERHDVSQRHLAQRLGVALGLANSYLKRCVRKGWVKVQQVPGNRYLYYLTPKGFVEKSRLSATYLSHSLAFYRRAGASCLAAFEYCSERGWNRIALCGISDMAEIAFVRSQERGIEVPGFVDTETQNERFVGRPVVRHVGDLGDIDACLVTDLESPAVTFDRLCGQVGAGRVLVPDILEWRPDSARGAGNG